MPRIPVRRRRDSATRVVWRPRLGRLVPHGLLPVVLAILVGLGLVMGFAIRPSDMMFFCLLGALSVVGLYLLGRPQLVADEHGLTVVNVWKRREIAWGQVLAVDMPDGEPWPRLDLADGSTLPVMGIQASDGPRAYEQLHQVKETLAAPPGS